VTGFTFSPSARHMYLCFLSRRVSSHACLHGGVLHGCHCYESTSHLVVVFLVVPCLKSLARTDGLPFHATNFECTLSQQSSCGSSLALWFKIYIMIDVIYATTEVDTDEHLMGRMEWSVKK